MNEFQQLESKRTALCRQLANIGDFRPGSLSRNYRKCGRPTCHCASEGDPGHDGWLLSRKVNARTVSRRIRAQELEVTRGQLEEHDRFRALIKELTEVSEALCDLRLKSGRGKKKRRTRTSQANLRR